MAALERLPARVTNRLTVPCVSLVEAEETIDTVDADAGSAVIVTVAVLFPMVAPDEGLDSTTVNVSALSWTVSPRI